MVGRQLLLRRLSSYTRVTMGYLKEKIVYDFVSDTATQPTDEMFEIMKQATRGDDVYLVSLLKPPLIVIYNHFKQVDMRTNILITTIGR